MIVISGGANGLRAFDVRQAVQHVHADGTSTACDSVRRAHKQLAVSVLNRDITFSASERRRYPLPFFQSRRPSRAIASTLSLRRVPPDVFSGHWAAPSRNDPGVARLGVVGPSMPMISSNSLSWI